MNPTTPVALYEPGVTRLPGTDQLVRAIINSPDLDAAVAAHQAESAERGLDEWDEAELRDALRAKVVEGHQFGSAVGAPLARVITFGEAVRDARLKAAQAPGASRTLAGCASQLPDLQAPPPPQEYLVGVPGDAFLPAHMVGGLVGPGSVGKSQLTVQLAVCLALGRPFLGYPIAKLGTTVIASGEDQQDDYLRKFYSVAQVLDLTPGDWQTLRQRVFIVDLTGQAVRLIEPLARGGQFGPGKDVELVAAEVARVCPAPDLIVVDTLSTLMGGTPEDVGPVSAFMGAMNTLASRFASRPAILVAHHTSKENAAKGSTSQDAGRGSSAFGNNARSVIVMAKLAKENIGAVQRRLGGQVPTEDREHLRVIQAVKVKGSRPRPMLVVELVPEPSGLGFAFRPYVLPVKSQADAEAEKKNRALAFRELVEHYTQETGKPASVNALVRLGVEGRSRRAVAESAAEAEALGLLRQEKAKRNGKVLVPLYPERPEPEPEELASSDQDAEPPDDEAAGLEVAP